jgi:peptide/nickel transport system substrate-binding protein
MLAIALAACGSSSTSGSTNSNAFDPANFNPSWLSANVNNNGSPPSHPTGTLKIEGSVDLSAALDPQGEYETIGYTVERAFTRQLVSYAASSSLQASETVVADAATTTGTVSPDGKTYTFHLRSGLMWNTSPARPVTSQDFVRGFKRICDPTLAPNGNPGYYENTIVGFQSFCTPFLAADPNESAAARAAYINGNNISGITTPNSSTIVFQLIEPTVDFDNILALPFTSAAPVEDLNFVPLTAGNPLYSDGPYQISNYNVGHELDLTPNPAWANVSDVSSSTDPIRHRYVAEVTIKLDLSGAAADTQVQQDMVTGDADLAWNTVVPTADIPSLTSPWNADFGEFPAAGNTNPYLVFNVQSPNNGGALGNVKVRQALEYAIDKVAMGKIYGGPNLNQPLNQVLGPGAEGYQEFNDYPTANNQGDPAKCKTLLAAAGYPNGLTLKDYYRDNGNHPAIYQEVLSDFSKCGVTVVGTPISTGYYGSSGIGVTSANGLKSGNWDITEPGWVPDWFGPTNARGIIPPLFDGAVSFPGSDWGGYDDPAVDSLINQAQAATTVSAASSLWHQADEKIMADAPFIPFQTQLTAVFHSSRVHNALYNEFAAGYDITQLWLS